MSTVVEFMISKGVDEKVLIMLLTIPIITTIVSISRHFVGIKSFGVFTPVLLSIAYASISDNPKTSIVYGLGITFLVIFSSFLLQYFLDVNRNKVFRMHYLPKLGMIITTISIVFFLSILLAATLDKSFARNIDAIPLLLIITLSEDFITKSFKKGFQSSLGITVETVLLSIIGFLLITFEPLQNSLLNHPEILLILIPINFLIGKYAGLRLKELFRFSDIEE
jgi:hypothetical protein